MIEIEPGLREGTMRVPASKSHVHRVLIAEFLSGRLSSLAPLPEDCEDVLATKRCLTALAEGRDELDCGESGTTRRLVGPVAAALARKVKWIMKGRLASRPQMDYDDMKSGVFRLPGDISSQFVSGLLFALPILDGDSEIVLTTPLASRGYVDLTLRVLRDYGIEVTEAGGGFRVKGNQTYCAPDKLDAPEIDWSGLAFVLTLEHLGNKVHFMETSNSRLYAVTQQPDCEICALLSELKADGDVALDVDERPDIFPVLTVAAAARKGKTVFSGTRRLKLKESDRVAAMADVLTRFGVKTEADENTFVVYGTGKPFNGGEFASYGDHRIAMSIAVGATRAKGVVKIDDEACAAKSFPGFFKQFEKLSFMK